MSDTLDNLAEDREKLIAAVESAIDHILANSSAFNDGTPKEQARFLKLVIKHVHQDLQAALEDVLGSAEPPSYGTLDDIPF